MSSITEIIHPDNSNPIAIVKENKVNFKPAGKSLEEILRRQGIFIPVDRQREFGNKNVVHIQDGDNFAKALLEIYFPMSLQPSGFKLKISNIS